MVDQLKRMASKMKLFDGQEWSFDSKHRNMSTNVKQGASVKAQTQWISTLYCWHTRSLLFFFTWLLAKQMSKCPTTWLINLKKWGKKFWRRFRPIWFKVKFVEISERDSPKMYDKIISFWIKVESTTPKGPDNSDRQRICSWKKMQSSKVDKRVMSFLNESSSFLIDPATSLTWYGRPA